MEISKRNKNSSICMHCLFCVICAFLCVRFCTGMVADLCLVLLSCFQGEKAPRKNPPNGDVYVFSHGEISPRHTKVRHFSCVAFSPPVCRIFAWRGKRSPRKNPPKSPFGVFSSGDRSPRQAKIRQTGAKTRNVATR